MQSADITHEVIAEATARYLAAGGVITVLPDTVAEQQAHLKLLQRLEGTDDLEELDGFARL